MKFRILSFGVLLALAPCSIVRDAGAADPTVAGSWVTDSVVGAKQMQAQLKEALKTGEIDPFDEDSPVARAYRNQVNNNPRNGTGAQSSGGGGSTTRSRGGTSGASPSTGGGGFGGGGGNLGGGGGVRSGGGGGGGGGRGGRGNNFLPASPQETKRGEAGAAPKKKEAEEEEEAFAPAITLELKATKDKLTGTIIEISAEDLADEKLKVEDGTIIGTTFKFVTYKGANGIQLPTRWEGQIVSDKTLKLQRKNGSGKVIDEVGELTFTRVK